MRMMSWYRYAVLALLCVLAIGACGSANQEASRNPEPVYCIHTGDSAGPGQMWLTLFFPDREGWYVVPEFRKVSLVAGGDPSKLAQTALEALMQGTDNAALLDVFPEDTELRGVMLEGSTLVVDMSEEFIKNHPGGSTWELQVLRAIVHTLLDIEGVDKAQFTVEGQRVESLAGHLAIDRPLERDPIETGLVRLDYDLLELAQKRVDGGAENWRTRPESAVCQEARLVGFTGYEEYNLLLADSGQPQSRSPRAVFQVTADDNSTYEVTLVQPVRTGPGGIWTVAEVNQASGDGR